MALPRLEIKNPVGVNKSLNPADLPLQVWSDVRNVRFKDGKVSKCQGYEEVFSSTPDDTLYLLNYVSLSTPFWITATATGIFRTEGGPSVDVSRTTGGPYNASENHPWNGGILNQVVILNNGVDVPQSLQPSSSDFQDLPNWPVGTTAKVIRPFKNYLVALNLVKDGNEQPTTVKWSSPADPGEVPFTWDETDPTNDAGENFLADTSGAIVDGKKLKDTFIIYKEDSVYSMVYIGGTFIFQFRQLFDDIGMIGQNCAAEFDGKHFVVGQGDVYVHNGVQKSSVIEGVMKEYLFSTMNSDNIQRTFVVPDYANSEMWVCYCSTDATNDYCDRALVWNWRNNQWTIRDIPQVFYGTYGIVNPQDPDYWDIDDNAWNTDTTVWGEAKYNPAKMKLLFTSVELDKLFLIGDSSLFDQTTFTSRVEKTDVYLDDDLGIKVITGITPHVQGTGAMRVWVGSNNIQNTGVAWQGPFDYQIGRQFKVDCRVLGRYIAVKFEADSDGAWAMNGFTVEYSKVAGEK